MFQGPTIETSSANRARSAIDALWADASLTNLRQALLGSASVESLCSLLNTLLPGTETITSCRIQWAEFKPGRLLRAFFDVEIPGSDPPGKRAHAVAVTWRPSEPADSDEGESRPWAACQTEAEARGLLNPWKGLAAEERTSGLRVQCWPLDSTFGQLVRVSDPRHVRSMIKLACAANPLSPALEIADQYAVTPVRYRPGKRHVLRFEPVDASVVSPEDRRAVYAKLYPSSKDAERAWRVAHAVAKRLRACGDVWTAHQPLGCVTDDAVVLYRRIIGTSLSEHVRGVGPLQAQHLLQAGHMLRYLHMETRTSPSGLERALSDDLSAHRGFAGEVKKITRRTCGHIPALLPELGARINAVLWRAGKLYDRLPQESPAFAHGDFKTEHLWLSDGGLKLMDFDSCCLADPAVDVGKLLADLEYWYAAFGYQGVREAQTQFLSAYAVGTPTDRLRRAWPYAALTLVKLAVHRLRLYADDWPARTAHLVGRAEAILEAQGDLVDSNWSVEFRSGRSRYGSLRS
jgi:aminoglycoside phosphotransferase (APT) family kinase protein